MTTFLRSALSDAMSRLKLSDVAGATAAIQRALATKATQEPPTGGEGHGTRANAERPRRLGDVLQALKANRVLHVPEPANSTEGDAIEGRDRFRTRCFGNAAGSLTYKLYVPVDHGDRKRALVVMLHGCTQDPDDFARGTQMNALADEFGLIVAYPHQPRSANAQGCWNWFDVRHQMRGGGEPAVLAGMAQELAAEFAIDRDRVFVAGLSAGGAMADVLSVTHPDVFAAVGVHSGLPHGAATDVMTAFAAMKGNSKTAARQKGSRSRKIVFHGTADATVHPSNGEMLFNAARHEAGEGQELISDITANGKRVTRTVIAPDTGRTIAEFWEIQGGGHAWSGGSRTGTFTDASGPDASREMIRFFLES